MEEKPKIYFENLDGLRFICFLSVFLFHSFHTEYSYIKDSRVYDLVKHHLVSNGNLGVNFFFVLSGFLITFLLIKEKEIFGRIDVVSFWKRRVFRIWPLFYFCVFFGFVIFPLLKQMFGQTPNESAGLFYYVSFLNNFDFIKKGLPDASVLGVLWSVAIEEQFYLVWPLLLFVLPDKFYPTLFVSVILFSVFFRFVNDSYLISEYHTFSCIGDMAVGALGAWSVQRQSVVEKLKQLNIYLIFGIYILVSVIIFFRKEVLLWSNGFERTIIAFVFLFVILEQSFAENSFFKMKNFKSLSRLGVITYGLYCLHFVGILITTNFTKIIGWNVHLWQVMILETLTSLLLSILIAKISYRYFETPFLLMGKKLAHVITERPTN